MRIFILMKIKTQLDELLNSVINEAIGGEDKQLNEAYIVNQIKHRKGSGMFLLSSDSVNKGAKGVDVFDAMSLPKGSGGKGGPLRVAFNKIGVTKFHWDKGRKVWMINYNPSLFTMNKNKQNTDKSGGLVGKPTTEAELEKAVEDIVNEYNRSIQGSDGGESELTDKNKEFIRIIDKEEDIVNDLKGESPIDAHRIKILNRELSDYNRDIKKFANSMDNEKIQLEIEKLMSMQLKLTNYSFNNATLIYIQSDGEATQCMNDNLWEKLFNREIINPNEFYIVLTPKGKGSEDQAKLKIELDKAEEAGDLEEVKRLKRHLKVFTGIETNNFIGGKTYDIKNTKVIDGKEDKINAVKWHAPDDNDAKANRLITYVDKVAKSMGIKILIDDSGDTSRGSSGGKVIKLKKGNNGIGGFSTFVHELAHELMHQKPGTFYSSDFDGRTKEDYDIGELQAETVAYMVLKHYGFKLDGAHQLYVTMYRGTKEKVLSYQSIIAKVSKYIVDKIDAVAKPAEAALAPKSKK